MFKKCAKEDCTHMVTVRPDHVGGVFCGDHKDGWPTNPPPVESIDQTLAERGARYGSFLMQSTVTREIKLAMMTGENWEELAADQKEALEMIALKIARILTGDPDFHDSWHDIVGYAKLVADRMLELKKEN